MSSKRTGGLRLAGLAAALAAPLAASGVGGDTAINPKSFYPEGPILIGDTLYYAEMGSDRVMRWDGKANIAVWHRSGCGPTSVARGEEGTLVVLCHIASALVQVAADGKTLEVIDRDSGGRSFANPNASINDARGGVYFSSSGVFSPNAPAEGAVLYLDAGGRVTRLAEGIRYANGVALSPHGKTLFVSEHLSRRVLAFDIAADATLSNRRVFVALDDLAPGPPKRGWEVGPDGLAVSRDGDLFIAEYGAGRILAVSPAGALLATLPVGEPYVTAMAFDEGGERLYLTAPASLVDPGQPGKVYLLANPVRRPE